MFADKLRIRLVNIRLVRFKQTYSLQQSLNINGATYDTDQWTNVTSKVLSYVGRNLHLEDNHPLHLLSRRVSEYFYKRFTNSRGNALFSVHDNLSPVVTTKQNFDQLLVPENHPSRSQSDTYYVNADHVLRAHTSAHQWELMKSGLNNFLVIGDVYRRDAIDHCHYPVFHQIEGVRLCTQHELSKKASSGFLIFGDGDRTPVKQSNHTTEVVNLMVNEMKQTIENLMKRLFSIDTEFRWTDAYFPFTHPSWELEIYHKNEWLEILGCGIMEHSLLESAGAGDKIGWAVGFGLERLAMKLYSIPDIRLFWSQDSGFLSQFNAKDMNTNITYVDVSFFKECVRRTKPLHVLTIFHPDVWMEDFLEALCGQMPVSQYPQCINDISFWIPETFVSTDFYDVVRSVGGDLVEQVTLVDEFLHAKQQRKSHCYRIVYRHMEKTLTQSEVNAVHKAIEEACVNKLNVIVR